MVKNKLFGVILYACVLSTLAYPADLPCGEGVTGYDCYNGPNNVEEMNVAVGDAISYFESVLQALGCSQFMNGAIVSFEKVIQPLMGFLNMALRRGCNSDYCGVGIAPNVIGSTEVSNQYLGSNNPAYIQDQGSHINGHKGGEDGQRERDGQGNKDSKDPEGEDGCFS